MAANQVDFKILPSDQFSVYSPQTRSDKVITYFTLLSKLRGDILSVGQDDDPNDIVSAFYSSVGGTQTLHLVKADGSEITASTPEQIISGTVNFVSKFTTANDIGDSQIFDDGTNVGIGTTSMTHKLQLGTGGVFADYYQLDTTYSNGFVIGAISWDIDNGTADIGLSSTLKLKIGQDDTWYVKNQSGSTITKGTVVYASGTLGASGRITIAPMIGDGTIPSRFLLGVVAENILNGADGYVIAKGKIRQINTNAFNDGDVLWLSPTVAGALTVTEPTAPNLKLAIAFVVHKATNGILAVRATEGVRIADASDVEYAGAADNSFLVYNSATGVWEDEAVSIFKTIAVAGQSSVVADTYTDTLTLAAGTGVTITTNAGTDTITISAPGATGGTVTSINITAGPKILSSGGPITTSGSITVSHEGATASDIATMTDFLNYVTANGGVVEAIGPVSEVIATLTGYEPATTTSNTGGTVIQNMSIDDYGHVMGISSTTLDSDDIIEGSTNLYFTNARARAAISTTATGLTYTSATGVLSLTAGYIIPTTTQETNWTAAYNDKINSASFNTTNGVITLTQQDAGTVTVDIDGRFINLDEKAAVNGVATLDAGGKVPTSQLPGGLLIYKGTWDASTNTPTLANGTGSAGDTYLCNVAGTVNFGAGNITFSVGDLAIYSGTIWERSGSASDVTSVNGFQGAVVLDLDDINDVDITSIADKQFIVYDNTSSTWKNRLLSYFTTDEITEGATNLFFTTARAQAAINAFSSIAVSGQSDVVADVYNDTLTFATSGTGFTITTDASTDTITFTNTLPDQTVVLTAGSGIGVTGTYPTFTIDNTSPSSGGTVTSISTTAPITGGTITTTGTIGITQSSGGADGYLSSVDWTTFNSKEPALTKGNLTETTSSILTIAGGTNAVIGSGTTIAVSQATTSTSGYLSSTDWNTFNAKEPVLTKGNLTEATSAILTITGGTGSVIGSGTTIAVSQATGSSSGYLSSTDWTTFNNKASDSFKTIAVTGQSNVVADSNSDTLTLAGGGGVTITTDASTDTITISSTSGTVTSVAIADGGGLNITGSPITSSGTITIENTDRGSGQSIFKNFAVTGSATVVADNNNDTVTFEAGTGITLTSNSSSDTITITNSAPSSGGTVTSVAALTIGTTGTDLSSTVADGTTTPVITLQVPTASATNRGALSSTDWTTFDGKQNALTLTTTGSTGAATLIGATLNIPNYADQFVGTVTSVDMSVPTGFAISGNPITTSGTLAVAFAAGYSLPTDASQATWNTAYNDSITAFAYNTSTGALTLTQQDAGTLTATVTLQPFTTSNLTEGTNLYYTDARARLALSAGTGISYDNATGVITNSDRGSSQNIFKNIAVAGQSTIVADTNDDTLTVVAGSGVTITTNDTTDTITISATGSGGTVTSVATTAPITGGTFTTTGTIGITQSGASADGYLSSTDWNIFNNKQNALTNPVTGTGTTNYVSKFTSSSAIGDSIIYDDGTSVGIGTAIPGAKLHVVGDGRFEGSLDLGHGSAAEYSLEIGAGRTGNGFAYVDLVGDTTYPDYGLRMIRSNGGANTSSTITHRGTGILLIETNEAAPIVFNTSASERMRILSGGNVGIDEANPTQKLHISGNLRVTGAYYDSSNNTGSSAQVLSSTGSGTQWVNANAGTVTSVDLTAGTGITVSGGPITSSGSITVTNDDRGSSQNIFKNIAVAGQSTIIADLNDDTLTVAAGTGISITTNATTDTLTITNTAASLDPKTESINIRATVPYSVTTPFDDVVIDTIDVKRNAPNTVTSTSKLLAIVTLQVENTGSTGFTGFTLRLFNQTTTTAVTNTTTKWSAYMYPAASEFGFTSFTYHIPIDDTSVSVSDPIQLQLQLEVGTCDISIANFTLMSISK